MRLVSLGPLELLVLQLGPVVEVAIVNDVNRGSAGEDSALVFFLTKLTAPILDGETGDFLAMLDGRLGMVSPPGTPAASDLGHYRPEALRGDEDAASASILLDNVAGGILTRARGAFRARLGSSRTRSFASALVPP